LTEAVRQGLRDHGYVEGQNIVIEHRVSETPKDNPALVAELLGRKIDILVTWTTPALVAAKKATSTIPIVGMSGDPIQTGLIASLARPGGNITGIAILTDELELKNLQLLWHPWLRINRLLRAMLHTRWSTEAWAQVRVESGGRYAHVLMASTDMA
jgi:putative tryptophan/tyrosine transport system substrate-binding protein